MVCSADERTLPSGVLGPVDLPPCILHTLLFRIAGERHCFFVRFDVAWHCLQVIQPPAVDSSCDLIDSGIFTPDLMCRS